MFAFNCFLVFRDDVAPGVRIEIGIRAKSIQVLEILKRILEHAMIDTEDHIAVHLDEAAIAVIGEARIARQGREAFNSLVVEAEVENGIHHAGH